MTFDPEFKKALQLLPGDEKDKLILRLLKLNLPLANKLRFELVDTDSVEDKREQIKNRIIKRIQQVTEQHYSPGYLLMDLRDISGEINEHISITKDKLGEISLNCLMLRHLLEQNNGRIAAEKQGKAYTLCIYIVARVFKILMLVQKQHEDLHLEFKEDIETIGTFIGNNPNLMKTAIHNGLDVNWLIHFNIPENIAVVYRKLRENGLLK
jgi:hypothetical protein